MNPLMINNNHHGVGLATNTVAPNSNKTTLFLGDLSAFCSERDIHEIFSPYGEVLEIKIMRSEETNRNLSYGFIKFATHNSAKRALNGLHGVLFCGRNLRVGWAAFKNKKEPKILQHHDRMDSSSVHVSYISYQLDRIITEESLRILFSSFGVVLDTSIKKSFIDQNGIRQCGYGFVHFASTQTGIESALASVNGLNDVTIDEVSYKCSVSHNLEKQLGVHQRRPEFSFESFSSNSFPFQAAQRRSPTGLNNFGENFQHHFNGWNNHMGNTNNVSSSNNFGGFPDMNMNRRDEPYHNNMQRRFSPVANSMGYNNHSHPLDSIDKSLVMRYRQTASQPSPQPFGMEGSFDELTFNRPLGSLGLESFSDLTTGSLSGVRQFTSLNSPQKSLFEDMKFPDPVDRESMGSNDSSNSAQSFKGVNKSDNGAHFNFF